MIPCVLIYSRKQKVSRKHGHIPAKTQGVMPRTTLISTSAGFVPLNKVNHSALLQNTYNLEKRKYV
jgi:hypothetical protein